MSFVSFHTRTPIKNLNNYHVRTGGNFHSCLTGTGERKVSKVAGQTLDLYCVWCELLSASIADTLLFVNILVSGIFHGHFAQRLAVNKPCLQIVSRLLWKQSTTQSIRNNNPMFGQQPLTLFICTSQYFGPA